MIKWKSTFAPSNTRLAVSMMSAVAEKGGDLKMLKYLSLDSFYLFMSVAVETCGAFGSPKIEFHSRSWTSPPDSY